MLTMCKLQPRLPASIFGLCCVCESPLYFCTSAPRSSTIGLHGQLHGRGWDRDPRPKAAERLIRRSSCWKRSSQHLHIHGLANNRGGERQDACAVRRRKRAQCPIGKCVSPTQDIRHSAFSSPPVAVDMQRRCAAPYRLEPLVDLLLPLSSSLGWTEDTVPHVSKPGRLCIALTPDYLTGRKMPDLPLVPHGSTAALVLIWSLYVLGRNPVRY